MDLNNITAKDFLVLCGLIITVLLLLMLVLVIIRDNDAHIFNNSDIGKAFLVNAMNVLLPSKVDSYCLPYVIVSDEIFAWKTWLIEPYSGKGLD